MSDFPFETVYEYFARPFVTIGLQQEQMPPMVFAVNVEDGKVCDCRDLPQFVIEPFFNLPGGKDAFGGILRAAIDRIGDKSYCIVLVSEAYYKMSSKEEMDRIGKRSIADDPDSYECVMIAIYRPEGTQMGRLHINPDRSLTYAPLYKNGTCEGRLAPSPKDDMPADAKVH